MTTARELREYATTRKKEFYAPDFETFVYESLIISATHGDYRCMIVTPSSLTMQNILRIEQFMITLEGLGFKTLMNNTFLTIEWG